MIAGIAALAVPAIITNITTPVLGLTDMAIVGHMGGAAYIAAIAVGGAVFNMLYWLLGFLRMGTSGVTAQCYGAKDATGCSMALARAMTVAMGLAAAILILQEPIFRVVVGFMDCDEATRGIVREYYRICVWGAPAVLGMFVLTGWWLGMQNSRTPMWVNIMIDALNIATSVTLVLALKLKIEGVAIGTLSAQWAGFLVGMWLCKRRYHVKMPPMKEVLKGVELKRYFKINSDIFLRTVCLVGVTMWFTRVGSLQGAEMLAVNALLMQLFTMFSFFMDGFAFAAEALCGRFKGSGNVVMLHRVVRMLIGCGGVLALVFTALYAAGGEWLLGALSSDERVVALGSEYFWWAVSIPLAGFAAFMWDGVSIGVSATRRMLLSMIVATALFFAVYALAYPRLGNHGLWLAFIVYLFTRGAALWALDREYW